jgi:hypothetical protein
MDFESWVDPPSEREQRQRVSVKIDGHGMRTRHAHFSANVVTHSKDFVFRYLYHVVPLFIDPDFSEVSLVSFQDAASPLHLRSKFFSICPPPPKGGGLPACQGQ